MYSNKIAEINLTEKIVMNSVISTMNPSVPTISVTPHSSSGIGVSTVNKQYSILEENLKQLHEIVEAVQHMKDSNFNTLSVSNQIVKIGEQCIRLSCSCPSLNELSSDTEAIGNSLTSSPSRVDLSLSKSTPYISVSSPSIHSKQREFEDWKSFDCRIINSLGGGEILRRRSWAALEDLSAQRETDLKIIKQRSSQKPYGTESETEEEILVSLLDNNCLQHFPYSDEIAQNTVFDAFLEEKSAADGTSINSSFSYDDQPEKRRKRGSSLFFRKKKVTQVLSKSIIQPQLSQRKTSNKKGVSISSVGSTQGNRKSSTSTALCYSPWRRVASKLGVNPIINEEKEDAYFIKNQSANDDHLISYAEEVPLVTQEFLNEEQFSACDLDTDTFLGLQVEEPDTWTPTVKKDIVKKLKEKEIKRQEHIYEFILTEKHHCLTLILMQKIFVNGLKKHFQLGPNLHRMFPRLSDLTEIHLKFLYDLRKKQKESPVIDSISDILLEQFSGNAASQLQAAYGDFCSRHRDAVNIYKFYLQDSSRFAAFVKYCQNNPMLKKKGIPECILFVTQRLTKYPLLIEPLIKTSENKAEVEKLNKALSLVRNILTEVDSRVAEKEKEDRKLEIYHKIDAKSFTMYRGNKFKKSDILSNNRKLRFEGLANLMQGRTKQQFVHVVVLSDILFFLVENNNKFSFFTPDNKPGIICLQKLLVRDKADKAGTDTRGIYLISSNPLDPEMFELKIHKPKDKNTWINSIRNAVQKSLEDEQQLNDTFNSLMDAEKQKRACISQTHINQIVGILRQKDVEQSLIYEEKISLLLKLLAAAGIDIGIEQPSYCHLVSEYLDIDTVRKEVFNTIQEPTKNVSSTVNLTISSLSQQQSLSQQELPSLLQLEIEQQSTVVQLTSHIYTLASIIAQQMTSIDSLEAQLSFCRQELNQSSGEKERKPLYKHNQQLEELRNLQDKLSQEKEQWQREKENEQKDLEEKRKQLLKLQEQIRNEQEDITEQREQLYRKLEILTSQGLLNANPPLLTSTHSSLSGPMLNVSSSSASLLLDLSSTTTLAPALSSSSMLSSETWKRRNDSVRWKSQPTTCSNVLPLNLISATNQQKVASSNVQVKQKLPLKLATKQGNSSTNGNISNTTALTTVSNSHVTISSPFLASSCGNKSQQQQQQILPWKLRESNSSGTNVITGTTEIRRSVSGSNNNTSCYERLISAESSNVALLSTSSLHSRTESSPAMMQNIQISSPSLIKEDKDSNKTNTYPKVPEKYRSSLGSTHDTTNIKSNKTVTEEEKVIFF